MIANDQGMLYNDLPTPGRVDVKKLSLHFARKYRLEENQVGRLVSSAAKSLREFITQATQLVEENGKELDHEQIRPMVHNGRGLFQTMGEDGWADHVSLLSQGNSGTFSMNVQTLIQQVRHSFSEIIEIE